MSTEYDAATFNQLLLDRLDQEGGEIKTAAVETDVVRDKIWETGFARRLIPPKDVDRNDPHVQESLDSDTVYYLEHVETPGYAMTVNFRGNGDAQVWASKKFPIGFHKIETMHHTTDEMTIRSMPYPFTKDIESKFPIFIQMVEDRELLLHLEAACQTIQSWDNGGVTALSITGLAAVIESAIRKGELARLESTNNWTRHVPQRADFAHLARLFPGFSGEQLKGETVLLSETDAAGFNTWQQEDVGSEGAWQITTDGYSKDTIVGYRFVRTAKTSILRPGNIYMIAPKEFGGKFLRFVDTTVALEKYGDRVETWAWEVIGMGFGNLRFVKKMELYSGCVTPTLETAGSAVVAPLSERQIIMENADPGASTNDGYTPFLF